jgi:hypothetical protein
VVAPLREEPEGGDDAQVVGGQARGLGARLVELAGDAGPGAGAGGAGDAVVQGEARPLPDDGLEIDTGVVGDAGDGDVEEGREGLVDVVFADVKRVLGGDRDRLVAARRPMLSGQLPPPPRGGRPPTERR